MKHVTLRLTEYEAAQLYDLAHFGWMILDDDEPWDRGEKATTKRALAKLRALAKPEEGHDVSLP